MLGNRHFRGVDLYTTDKLTPDVLDGLILYGLETGELKPQDAEAEARRWMTLFTDNPLGSGLFTVAKKAGEIIGFFALIDMEMVVDGQKIKAGKGEFWVVHPKERTASFEGRKLPLVVFDELRQQAASFGYKAIVSVTSHAAGFMRRDGDTKVVTDLAMYSFPPRLNLGRFSRLMNRLFHRSAPKLLGQWRGSIASEDVVEQSLLTEPALPIGGNWLSSSSPDAVNARFPVKYYVKFVLNVNDKKYLYVFTRPKRGEAVYLSHWSGFPDDSRKFESVIAKILAMMDDAGAVRLNIHVPVGSLPASYELKSFGFEDSVGSLADCYLKDTGGVGISSAREWQVTHAHMGVYSYLAHPG